MPVRGGRCECDRVAHEVANREGCRRVGERAAIEALEVEEVPDQSGQARALLLQESDVLRALIVAQLA